MALKPNQASGSGSVPAKGKPAKPSKPSKPAGGYDWNDGKGARHSIPLDQHQLNSRPLDAPPSYKQATLEANAAADLKYGPQVQQAQQQAANVAPWFQEHMGRVAGYAQAAQAQAAPIVTEAQTFQQNTGAQTAPGLDPNSDAGKAAAMAAQGRQALAALGTQALQTNAQSTQDYFGGLQATASKQLPQAQQAAAQNVASAQSQRGQAVTGYMTDARQNAQNYAIAKGTLNANVANQAADNATQAASAAETVRHHTASESAGAKARREAAAAKGQTVNKYGFSNEQWQRFSPSHRQRVIAEQQTQSQAGANSKDATKHANAITKASGGVQNTVTDIIGGYDSYVGKTTDDTSKPIMKNGQPVKGPDGKPTYEPRKLTKDDIKAILKGQNKKYTPQLIHIALMRREGKPLGQGEIDYLHNLDPNIRIPRDWLPKKSVSDANTQTYGKAPSQPQGHY